MSFVNQTKSDYLTFVARGKNMRSPPDSKYFYVAMHDGE